MTLEERFAERYPKMKSGDIAKRIVEYDLWRRELCYRIHNMTPRLRHSEKFLDVERLAPMLCKHTYGTICEYGWAFKELEGFDAVASVAEEFGLKVNLDEPSDSDDYILPTMFSGDLWDVFYFAKIKKYSELVGKTLNTSRLCYQLSVAQRDALKARNIKAKLGRFQIAFEPVEADYCEQYARDGYICIKHYVRSTAEAIEEQVQSRYPSAHLQFDRDFGVVIR